MQAKIRNQKKFMFKEEVMKKHDLATRTQMTTTLDAEILLKAKQVAKESKVPLSRIIDAALVNFFEALEKPQA